MNETPKVYDLEERTFMFAQKAREFLKQIPRTLTNLTDGSQLSRSSGSIGANYIEANESLSKKDYYMRVRISRKEAKESSYWLKLIEIGDNSRLVAERDWLVNESIELTHIFGSIISKAEA